MTILGKRKSKEIAGHYNKYSDYYLKHYGHVIQAHRTANIETLLGYLAKKMALHNGMSALDMGCGYCGPTIYFAEHFNIHLTCITNSKVQAEVAAKEIRKNSLHDRIKLIYGDYHDLAGLQENSFDLIFFLESFGHSYNWRKLIPGVYRLLRNGGKLFIKDYAAVDYKQIHDKPARDAIKESLKNISKHYKYKAIDKPKLIRELQDAGFSVCSDTPPGYELDNKKVVDGFEKELGIKIYALDHFKPYNVNAFEILCEK